MRISSLPLLLHTLLLSLPLTEAASTPKHQPWHDDSPVSVNTSPIGKIQTRPTVVYKPRSLDKFHEKRRKGRTASPFGDPDELEWDAVEVLGPNVEDRHTLAQLARMAGNAYSLGPGRHNWYEVDDAWSISFPFGWEDEDGFRGHVFTSLDNNTVILSIKGTTLQGPTSKLDKFNDNLLFSCCCGYVSGVVVIKHPCNCYASGLRCDNRCLTDALVQESLFYSIGTKLVDDLFRIYPTANVWLVGHSLGGALASLLGVTYGLPAVAFESPGERLAAYRLQLPIPPPASSNSTQDLNLRFPTPRPPRPPPSKSPLASYITHVYHTADPIPFGTCSGLYSACATAGYALETRCHLGKSIILDTVNRLHWLVDVRKHVIKEVVKLLDSPETGGKEIDWGDEGEFPEDPGPGEPPGDPWFVDNGLASRGGLVEVVVKGVRALTDWRGWTVDLVKGRWGPGIPGRKKKKRSEEEEGPKYSNRVPKPVIEADCVECHKWEFGDFKDDWG
ncbi:lipase [Coprinopsis cinerea okayama7|uniref:triacylglycerol lipase n=1 Tax=Coprinopsis cinerea (strain Okayama-7 / 130 / ATCC MYA-4618 / FGSC 9003) TaxID=240176 RepID=A8NE80_COPC7|nr:lipase [Coprinopsis cinerea okayama7\|eukprot:XP_001832955.1 lipase [Coprinopsis cinerea okayama7\